MIKKFTRIIQTTQSRYKATLEKKDITQQCSYNLPIEVEEYLKSLGALIRESDPGVTTNVLYGTSYDVVLSDNILAIIGNSYKGKASKVVFTHTEGIGGTTKKLQLKKTDFANKKNPDYNWFVDLYQNNIENTNFVVLVDDVNRVITFDVELTTYIFTGVSTEDSEVGDGTEEVTTKSVGGYNKYYYGAPGCGKSFHVKKLLDDYSVDEKNRFRVTFHPEYSNSDFVGQILPTIVKELQTDGSIKETVKYIFNPGPFTKALIRAYQTDEMVYLIIEELNRGNASAIFGDLFQLLDRVDDPSEPNFSESQYAITNVNVHKYIYEELASEGIKYRDNDIIIPSNLTILATMNTSDQNVFTLDTAFKRRWQSEEISNDIEKDTDHKYKSWFVPGTNITWEKFLTKLNNKILDYKVENSTSEDKRLGKYFVNKSCLTETAKVIGDCTDEANNFAYKVLEYIWNDVCKYGQSDWFDTKKYRTLEELLNGFNVETLAVFQNIDFNE